MAAAVREQTRDVRLAAAQRALLVAEANAGLRQRLTGVTTLAVPAAMPSEVDGVPAVASSSSPGPSIAARVSAPPELLLPAPAAVASLLPEGAVRRGSAVQVSGSVSLLMAMAAAACTTPGTQTWCAVVAMPDAGLAAAAEAGLDLERTVVVPRPGPDAAAVLGALIDGFDVVVLGRCPALSDADRRTLGHRLRTREAVLLSGAVWPVAQVVLEVGERSWFGVGSGDGVLTCREVTVTSYARGMGLSRSARVRLSADGGVHEVPVTETSVTEVPVARERVAETSATGALVVASHEVDLARAG